MKTLSIIKRRESMKDEHKKDYYQMFDVLISAVKVVKPSLTDKQAKNVIINLTNFIQLEDLGKSTK